MRDVLEHQVKPMLKLLWIGSNRQSTLLGHYDEAILHPSHIEIRCLYLVT